MDKKEITEDTNTIKIHNKTVKIYCDIQPKIPKAYQNRQKMVTSQTKFGYNWSN